MIEAGLFAFLSADSGVLSLVGDGQRARIFPMVIPQKMKAVDQVPCVVYQVTQEDRQKVYCGTQKLVSITVTLDCYAMTLIGARQLSEAVRAVLVDYRGLMGDVVVRDVTLSGGLTLYDMEPGLMRVMDTYTIWFEEE